MREARPESLGFVPGEASGEELFVEHSSRL
jgi:hypothetical protein